MSKQKRVYGVTGGQIWAALIITTIALTIVFEVGVWIGKKRLIDAERRAAEHDNIQVPAVVEEKAGDNLPERGTTPISPFDKGEAPAQRRAPAVSEADRQQLDDSQRKLQHSLLEEQPKIQEKELQYTIQIGTFSSFQNAENLVKSLQSHEYESWLKQSADANRTLYYVFVGRFSTRDEAEQSGRSLQEKSYITDYEVKKLQE